MIVVVPKWRKTTPLFLLQLGYLGHKLSYHLRSLNFAYPVLDIIPEQVKEFVGVGSSRPRFRKRDKVLFYGRKMLRKVKSISGQVHQSKKRKLFLKFARKLLQLRKDTSSTQLQVRTYTPVAGYCPTAWRLIIEKQ